VKRGDIVYSFGVDPRLDFERDLVAGHGARVFVFDPAGVVAEPDLAELPTDLRRVDVGLAGSEPQAGGRSATETAVRWLRLPSIMRMLSHRRLDLLKLGVDGEEYGAIGDLLGMDVDVGQILVRFHHDREDVGPGPTETAIEALADHGYRIFHISPDGRAYSFIRTDFAAS